MESRVNPIRPKAHSNRFDPLPNLFYPSILRPLHGNMVLTELLQTFDCELGLSTPHE